MRKTKQNNTPKSKPKQTKNPAIVFYTGMLSCILYTVYTLESGYLGESMEEEGAFIKYKCLKKPCALLILLQMFCSWLNATDRQ